MFHTLTLYRALFRTFFLLFCCLVLSGCADDIRNFFNTTTSETFSQAQTTATPVNNISLSSSTADVVQKPKIISHPKSITAYAHQPMTLSVSAQSLQPIGYQWYKNNRLIMGANQSSYHVEKCLSSDQGFYHVVLKSGQSEVRSLTARVTYLLAPAKTAANSHSQLPDSPLQILRQPASQTVSVNKAFSLSVSAQSTKQLSYQWFRNDAPISGATSPIYSVVSAASADQGRYHVLVRDENTSIRSTTALISVLTPTTSAIELTWDTPQLREDGTSLKASDIQAYRIEYGQNFFNPEKSIKVPHQTANRFILREIPPGILYLRIATIDIDGFQGTFSDTISVHVN